MSTDVIEKPAAAPAAATPPAAPAPAAAAPAATPAPTDKKPAAAAPAAAPASEKPAAAPAAKPATSFLDDVEDDDDEEAPAEASPAAKDGEAPADKKPVAEAKWRDDWREALAGDDAKFLAELKRFASFDNYAKSTKALRQKLSSGEYKRSSLPEDATPEEVAAWRADNGIPEAPDKYELPAKVELSDADKPLVDSFLTKLHAANTPAPIAKAAIEWYGEFQQQQKEARAVADREQAIAIEDKYRADWGGDYKANLNILKRALRDPELMPDGLGSAMVDARMPDGTLLRNHPSFFTAFANLAREKYGEASMIPGDTMTQLNSREDELVKMMKNNYDEYMHKTNARGQTFADELLEIRRTKDGGKRR